jgi:2-methylcitrate dehydratase PrpD
MLMYREPKTGSEGRFSMPFVIAMAIRDGRIGLASFTDENAHDPLVRQLIAKTEFDVDPRFAGKPIDEAPASVTITTKDGQVWAESIEDPLGSPTKPMTDEALRLKFRDCLERRLTSESIDRALEILGALEQLPDVDQLIRTLTPTTMAQKH